MVYKIILFVLVSTISLSAQSQKLWKDISEKQMTATEAERQIIPTKYRLMSLDFKGLKMALADAPVWHPGKTPESASLLSLPTPDGGWQQFKIVSASIFAPELAAKYPEIQSFKGWGIDDPSATLRFDFSPQGFHAMIISDQGSWYVDPYAKADVAHYVVYHKRDFVDDEPFVCGVEETGTSLAQNSLDLPEYGDCQFRTYRLALACTGEYAQFHGGTVAGALAAMNTSMTRVNGVYEREFALTMVLVGNNDQLVYLDPDTDPYTNNDGGTMLGENQTTVDNVIGDANYDIGHVFSTGGGGIAALFSPCSSHKAQGVTGRSAPVGDPFDIDYVAHEMGHQYGANHTQNNACYRNDPTAMEPGSASTIMGYAGICFPNVQNNSDDYFHTISMVEIYGNITTGPGSGCPTTVTLSNQAPTVSGGADYTIPVSTPFVLEAVGTDGDNDPITYCWEQMDPQTANMPPESTSTGGPAFRSFNPTASPRRYFPALSEILNNNSPTWEVLPSVSRTMNFRVTVRDNNPNGGCVAQDDIVLTTSANAGPFLVTQPNTNVDWSAQSTQTVTWDVANTNTAPVNATTVDILLSMDGGQTYPIILATNVPNDGSESVTMPAQTTNTARIMVKAHGNVFFDIGNTNFTISAAQSGFSVAVSQDSLVVCAPNTSNVTLDIDPIAGFTGDVSLVASNVPTGLSVSFSPQTVTVPGTSTVTLTASGTLSGQYDVYFDATGSTGTVSKVLHVIATNAAPAATTLLMPTNGATDVAVSPVLKWTAVDNTLSYKVDVFSDANLTNLVESHVVYDVDSLQLTSNLNPATEYFWQVTTTNSCQANVVSNVFSFTTKAIFCTVFSATDIPVTIPSSSTGTITSTIHIPASGALSSIKVKNLDITHSWINDLKVKLISPGGVQVSLLNQICNGENNIFMSFDDAATNSYASIPCPPVSGDTYHPAGSLNTLLGESVQGDWVLSVEDVYTDDGGSLNGWSLDICYLVDSLSLMVNTTDVSCANGSDGSAEVVIAGGAAPYNMAWSAGNGSNLTAGSYSVTVTDNNGDTASTSFVIHEPSPIELTASISDASPGASDGAINLTVGGGTPSYTYLWSNAQTTQDINGLAANTYLVTVTDSKGCTGANSFVVGESCLIPSQIVTQILSSSSAQVSWGAIAGVDSYQIRYRVVGTTTWLSQTVMSETVTLTGLTPSATYELQVQAHCTGGWSDYSGLEQFTLPAPCDMPINVTTITVASNTATLGWDAVSGATGYVANYRKLGNSLWQVQSTSANSISLSGLEGATSYEFVVKTECGNFSSNSTDIFVFTTMQACSPPMNITATNLSYQSFKLDWQAVSGVTIYSVRYRVVGTGDWASINVSETTVTLDDLESGATYEFQIQSKCGVAWSDFSELAQNTLPTGCHVFDLTTDSISSHSVGLKWTATDGATKYLISYGIASSPEPVETKEVVTNSGTIDGLLANSVYSISVRAYCEFGWGAATDINVQTSPDGIFEVTSGHPFLLYPNPVASVLHIELTEAPSKVLIYNVLGQVVWNVPISMKMEIPIESLESGLYFVRVHYKDGTESDKKFLKVKGE